MTSVYFTDQVNAQYELVCKIHAGRIFFYFFFTTLFRTLEYNFRQNLKKIGPQVDEIIDLVSNLLTGL